ncbi:restriction endonuclease subunit S [Dielma fastidiosa]|uniref:restriction endonuclease subunit S n=1 Tax=Dielma fastidiosa TaxID=1034346 RepID=UPI000D7B526F|nr:restriction endonuclease subunit S [Dielma fastidiosa]PWM54125.1 MAG: hypothetical protein DBX92_14305 [Dielma fastidiosa]
MNPNWQEVALSDIGRVVGGATPSTKNPNFYDGDIVWITPKDLSGYKERKISKGAKNITQEGYDSCSTCFLPKGSILFSSRAPIGYVAIADCELCTNQGFKSIVPDKNKVDGQFLFYALKFNAPRIESMASGTTFKEVSGAVMKKVRIKCPKSLSDQRKIANILSSFDDKIEINNRIINNLEEQRFLLFKYKFIEHKTGELVNLESFVEQTLGGDWGKDTLQDKYSEKVHCIRGADIPSVSLGGVGKCPLRYITKKNFDNKKIEPNMIVVELSGGSPTQSTGRSALISKDYVDRFDGRLICTNFCRSLKIRVGYEFFFYEYWKFLYDTGIFFNFENGTTGIKNLDMKSVLNKTKVFKPDNESLNEFNNFAKLVQRMQMSLSTQNNILEKTRDSILPKIISGELAIIN